MNTRYDFLRDLIVDGIVKTEFVRSENNDSDIFPKNLGKELFIRHSEKFMKTDTERYKGRNEFLNKKKEGCWKHWIH